MNEKEIQMKDIYEKLTEQNQNMLLLLARGMEVAQQNQKQVS